MKPIAIVILFACLGCTAQDDKIPDPQACADAKPEYRVIPPEYPGDCFGACYGAPIGEYCGAETWGPCASGEGIVIVGVCRRQCATDGSCQAGFAPIGTGYGCFCAQLWSP